MVILALRGTLFPVNHRQPVLISDKNVNSPNPLFDVPVDLHLKIFNHLVLHQIPEDAWINYRLFSLILS